MKEKIPKEVLQFFLENGTIVDIVEGQKKYTFMPFWFEVVDADNGIVVFHSLGNVPEELKAYITEQREPEKIIVTKEWYEDEESKTGWIDGWWTTEDGTVIDESIEVEVTDWDKYYHPIEGYYIKK